MATAVLASIAIWRPNSDLSIQTPTDIEDYLFWEARELTPFKLTAADNKSFNLDDLKGKWSFIFFGYTHCPDICPTTLNVLAATFEKLARKPAVAPEIQGVFVSVDPKRDTPELLKKYVSYFDDGFSGITGSTAQIDALTRQVGALYALHSENEKDTSYEVTHNSTIFLIDPEGRLYGRFPPPQVPRVIADTFVKIRAFYEEQVEARSLFFWE
ncbi:MAG: SCO family protein [Mariprofundaceae bacterium]